MTNGPTTNRLTTNELTTKLPISVIILTYNEEKNIEECLKSVYGWVEEIFIVRDGQVFSDNLQQFLSGLPLSFIPLPSVLAERSSTLHPGSCRQDLDETAACYIDQRTL